MKNKEILNSASGLKIAPADNLIEVTMETKEVWKDQYTFKARFFIRLVSMLFPGFLKLNIKQPHD